jgi:hypothetical protein
MTSVAVYYAGIPPKNNKAEKRLVLENFAKGVLNNTADSVDEVHNFDYRPTDLAVIQGWVHENSQTVPHLIFRKKIIEEQKKHNGHTLAIDSNLFLYKDPGNSNNYLRFSLDDVFPIAGNYFNTEVDPARWEKIKTDLNFDLQPWRREGSHILICLQRNGGWSMKGLDVMDWLHETIKEIRKYSKRHIIVRGHPGDRAKKNYLKINMAKVFISDKENISQDLRGAWATITYNSSPGVASAIEGIPVFVTDPLPKNSQAFDVCNTDLSQIENPLMPERLEWIQKISMSHWNFNDLKSGAAWNHMRKYL